MPLMEDSMPVQRHNTLGNCLLSRQHFVQTADQWGHNMLFEHTPAQERLSCPG